MFGKAVSPSLSWVIALLAFIARDADTEYTPVLIYAAAALALFLTVFLRGSHKVFCLGLVNGAVFAACCCLRDAPRKKSYTYHLSQP